MGTEQAAVLLMSKALENLKLSVQGVEVGGGHWERYERPKKVMEEALARSLARPRTAEMAPLPQPAASQKNAVKDAKKSAAVEQVAEVMKQSTPQTGFVNSPGTSKLIGTSSSSNLEDAPQADSAHNKVHDQLANIAAATLVAV